MEKTPKVQRKPKSIQEAMRPLRRKIKKHEISDLAIEEMLRSMEGIVVPTQFIRWLTDPGLAKNIPDYVVQILGAESEDADQETFNLEALRNVVDMLSQRKSPRSEI